MRALSVLFLLCAVLAAPFVWTSLALDERGVVIPGTVSSKREDARVHGASWTRTSEVTFRYEVPESLSAAFFTVNLSPEEYDSFHVGQQISVRYLRAVDVPNFPTSHTLREMHVLPMARLANTHAFSGLTENVPALWLGVAAALLGAAVLLAGWRFVSPSTFWWPAGALIIAGAGFAFFSDFPRPTSKPAFGVQQAEGKVKNITRITRLLQSRRSRGIDAKQPIDVIEVEFVPAIGLDPVLAVDLIDEGSLGQVKQGSAVQLTFERNSPRVAQIAGARRDFQRLNFEGALQDGLLYLAVLGAGFGLWLFVPWWWKRTRRAQA